MTWLRQCYGDEERPQFIGVWQPLPAGYSPIASLADLTAPTLHIPFGLNMLMPTNGKLHPSRDPAVGVFVPPDYRIPPDLLAGGTHFQDEYIPYPAHPFAIGIDALDDEDARIGGDRIPPMHGELPTDTQAASENPDRLTITVDPGP